MRARRTWRSPVYHARIYHDGPCYGFYCSLMRETQAGSRQVAKVPGGRSSGLSGCAMIEGHNPSPRPSPPGRRPPLHAPCLVFEAVRLPHRPLSQGERDRVRGDSLSMTRQPPSARACLRGLEFQPDRWLHFRANNGCGSAAYRGRSDRPISSLSMAWAACRPSRIAQTTSDCPRRMSPAANSLGRDVR